MQYPLILTTFLMGLAGGPHCIAMCGAACGGLQKKNGAVSGLLKFQLGRLMGYASLGVIAAASVKSLAWFTDQTFALHPIWTFFHVLVFCWGLMLLAYARQPTWADNVGRHVWSRVRHVSNLPGGMIMTGMLWALMPCGLLYSALLVASLNANPFLGGLSMATFAVGTSFSLIFGPWLWLKLKNGGLKISDITSMRLAGLLLSTVAGWAIWMDVMHQVKVWCI